MLRIIKIVLVLTVAVWGLIGVLGNIVDWGGTTGAVGAATSMSTFDPVPASGRATSNAAVIFAGAMFIVLLKALTGLLCLAGAWRMWGARSADAATFGKAKAFALTGCGVAVFMLFMGWIVIAETWFELWRSPEMRSAALDAAFRYAGFIGLIALFVGAREEEAA
jgi:predicted small integral membrane protein